MWKNVKSGISQIVNEKSFESIKREKGKKFLRCKKEKSEKSDNN